MQFIIKLVVIILLASLSLAEKLMAKTPASIANGFAVYEKKLNFNEKQQNNCQGVIFYPELLNNDRELSFHLSAQIKEFAEKYAVCNQGAYRDFRVEYNIPPSGNNKYFSVQWFTYHKQELYRLDSLNLGIDGTEVTVEEIFTPLSDQLMPKLVDFSAGHLPAGCDWQEFVEKVKAQQIQFYIKNQQWFIVFNPSIHSSKVIIRKLPNYFTVR